MIWALLAAAVAALFGGTIAILKTRKDRGLIETASGEPLHWPRKYIPLMVLVAPEVYVWAEAIEAGCKLWNERVGAAVFVYGGEAPPELLGGTPSAGIVVVKQSEDEHRHHTKLKHNDKGELIAAPIRVDPRASTGLRDRIVVHELGHALGLDHDDSPDSVMYPTAVVNAFEITDHDVEVLRRWYT